MILRGASGDAAEVPFHLSTASDPLTPLIGHSFTSGEVIAWWPSSGTFANADPTHVVEKGFGDYALQGIGGDTAIAGTVYVFVLASGAQPTRAFEFIADPTNPAVAELPFVLVPASDPIDGDGSGHAFALGEVQFRFSGAVYADVPLVQIVERGHSIYAVVLTSIDRTHVNKAYIYAAVAAMMPFSASWDMDVATFIGSTGLPPPPPGATPYAPTVIGSIDHVQVALSRLCEQFRSHDA